MQSKWSNVKSRNGHKEKRFVSIMTSRLLYILLAVFLSILMRQNHWALFKDTSDIFKEINFSSTEYRNKNYFLQETED